MARMEHEREYRVPLWARANGMQRYADDCDRPPDDWTREVVGDGCAVVNRTAAKVQQRTGQPQ